MTVNVVVGVSASDTVALLGFSDVAVSAVPEMI